MKDTNEYQMGFSFCHLSHALGVGLWVCPEGKKIFFKHSHVAYRIDGDDEHNRMQVKISSLGQPGSKNIFYCKI